MSVLDPFGIQNVWAVGRNNDLRETAGDPQHIKDRSKCTRMNRCFWLFDEQN